MASSQARARVVVLGATGSIGTQVLDVVSRHPERFEVVALAAGRDDAGLAELAKRHQPRLLALAEPQAAARLRQRLAEAQLHGIEVLEGDAGLETVARAPADVVVAAITGVAGLKPAWAALAPGRTLLLANKEALVASGELLMQAARQQGVRVVPVDSEHNALAQCLPEWLDWQAGVTLDQAGVVRLDLTASGGPFRGRRREDLVAVTPQQAVRYPNWAMGAKISVDSATLMNKGLEVIEAARLFALSSAEIGVLVHPQSVVHGLVHYRDGSVLAMLSPPDMRVPLAHGLAWAAGVRGRLGSGAAPLDLAAWGRLEFEPPDVRTFPCLGLAYAALDAGGAAPCVLNAANEEAVHAFLAGRLAFPQIAEVIETVLARDLGAAPLSLEAVLQVDGATRIVTRELIHRLHRAQ